MTFLFRMTFTGLCAFVPRLLGAGEEPQGTVLLVDATKLPYEPCKLCLHYPRLGFLGGEYDLRGKELSIAFPKPPDPRSLVVLDELGSIYPPPELPKNGTQQHRDSFWVANMTDLRVPYVADECFAADTQGKVTARVKLTSGNLTTSHMIEDLTGRDRLWNFSMKRTSGGDQPLADVEQPLFKRVLAAEFSLTTFVEGEFVELRLNNFGGGMVTPVRLTPVAGEVVVTVENSCVREREPDPPPAALYDFEWFYRLAADPNPIIYLPYLAGGGDYSDTYCPPAKFSAHPNA